MKRAKSVTGYIQDAKQWRNELMAIRKILQATQLDEEIKWGGPCYCYQGKNVVGLGAYKSYFGLWFHQGALLQDDSAVLMNAQEGKTKALRQWRMTAAKDIKPATIKRYVKEAIGHIESGRAIKAARNKALDVPQELHSAIRRYKGATAAFRVLRPGLQREYAEYVSAARQLVTKQKRIAKILPMITEGVGLNDQYRR